MQRGDVAIVVMGVSGCGKTSLAQALAAATGARYVEADALHSTASVAKMAASVALVDADRWPWLAQVGAALAGPGAAVAACSALKRSYRDVLRAEAGRPVRFVFLVLDREVLVERMTAREGHYMPVSLLDSQLATLEQPAPEEDAIVLAGDMSRVDQLEAVLTEMARRG